jgi:predicted lipoprotein with Yx(FWY)xxD motif
MKAPEGVDQKDLGFFTRDDEGYNRQSTFRGYPLYYFAGDKKPGDTNGQGLRDAWFVIDPKTFMK